MSWSKKYKKSIDCSNPKGFSQKAHCAGRKARQGGKDTKSKSISEMKISQLKEQIRSVIRERFISESSYKLGSEQYTKKTLSPTEIHSLANEYLNTSVNKMYGSGKKMDTLVNVANDLARLTGTTQQSHTKRGNPALLLQLLKNNLVDKNEYIKLYRELIKKQESVIKTLKNADPASRMVGGAAARQAYKDMKGEFEESINEIQLKKGDKVKLKNGETLYILGPKGDGYDYSVGREKGHHPKGWFDMMISSKKATVESVNEAITNPKKSNPNDLATTVIGWYDFATDYIDDGGQRRTAIKKNDDVVKWFDSHPLDVKQKAFKVMLSKQPSLKSKIERIFGSSLKESVNEEILKPGTKVKVQHKGKTVSGKIVRYDSKTPGSPFYIVYTGQYDSIEVPAYQVKKESVNEAKTYKKGDKLKIKLPNGKKFDVVFDMYSSIKGVALGKFKDGSGEYTIKPFNLDTIVESVNESTEPQLITKLRDIVKNQQYQTLKDPKSGKSMKVDMQTANVIVKVYDALKDPKNKEKFYNSGLLGMQTTAFKLMK